MGKRGFSLLLVAVILVLTGFSIVSALITSPELVLHLGFEENFDPNNHFEDSSNYNNDGICYGSFCPQSRITNPLNIKVGVSSVRFKSAEGDYVKVPSSQIFQQFHNAFSISLWIKTGNINQVVRTLVVREDKNLAKNDRNFLLQLDQNGRPTLRFSSSAGAGDCNVLGATNDLRNNQWHHIAAFYDSSIHRCVIYVDGSLVGEDYTIGIPQGFGDSIFVGAQRLIKNGVLITQAPYEGWMDDLRIYSRVLSEIEIASLFRGEQVYTCCDGGFQDNCYLATINECRGNGDAVMECVPGETTSEGPPGELVNFTQTNTTNPPPGSWVANLTRAVISTGVNNTAYVPTTFDCDDFANALERNLTALGYDATYTVYWCTRPDGSRPGHCVTDVHAPDGTLVFIDGITNRIVNLDFDGDGRVEARNHHPAGIMNTDDNCAIEVYEDAAAAAAAGTPRD